MARVDNNTFSMVGDWRGIYQVGRRVKLTVNGLGLVGDVAQVTYSGGLTNIVCVDLYDSNGYLSIIGVAPTQVAYGPLTAGLRGNSPQRFESVKVPAGYSTFELKSDGTDLLITKDSMLVAAFSDDGMEGLVPGSVDMTCLAIAVQAMLVPTATIAPFAGSTAPTGWIFCAGQAVSRTTYASLFAVIGTTYGAGDGSTTFGAPDLRGRMALGLDNTGGTDAGRLSVSNTLGGSGGAQTKSGSTASYTLTVADIPAHSHVEVANSNLDFVGASGTGSSVAGQTNSSFSGGTSNQILTRSTGGGGSHSHSISNFDVLPPYLLINYIIKV